MRSNLFKYLKNPYVTHGLAISTGAFSYHMMSNYKKELKELFDRQIFTTMFTVATQPISVPVLNLLIAKLNGESYVSALRSRLSKNPVDLYQSLLQNTFRRSCGSIPSAVLADYLTSNYNFDKKVTALFATAIETSLSLAMGEIKEKRKVIKKAYESYNGFYSEAGFQKNKYNGSIAGAITIRNGLFMAATFAVEPLSEFICELTNSSAHKSQITGALRYALTIASVVPENIANQLVMGKSLNTIIFDSQSIKILTRGALARGLYGALASWSIATGLNLAKKYRENDRLEIKDFFVAIFEQLDILLLKDASSQQEYNEKADRVLMYMEKLAIESNKYISLDYDDMAIERSLEAMNLAKNSIQEHKKNISVEVSPTCQDVEEAEVKKTKNR